jgi:hypothetical protein
MKEKTKTILVRESLHSKIKWYSEKSGIKIKVLMETAIIDYLKKIIIPGEEYDNGSNDSK